MSTTRNDRTTAIIAFLAFCCTSLLTIIPVLRHKFLPLVDIPNHIARHYLATAPSGPLDRYYEYTPALIPNSAVDFMWIVFGTGMDPVDFSRYTIAFYCVTLIGSTMLLSRVLHGKWSAWPAATALVCFNECFFWGFQNFIVSVPFAILSLTIWLWSEKLSTSRRVLLFFPIVITLYLLHFFAFAGLAIAVFGREVQRIVESGKNWKDAFTRASFLAIPFLVPIAWLASDVFLGPESPAGNFTKFGSLVVRIHVLQSVVLGTGLELPTSITISGLIIFTLLLVFVGAVYSKLIFGGLAIAPQMRGPLLMLCIFALLMPYWLNGVAMVHIRLPIILASLFFAATQWRSMSRRNAIIVLSSVALLLIGRSIVVEKYAGEYSTHVEDFVTLVHQIPQGERLISTTLTTDKIDTPFWHVGAYAVPYGEVFVPTLFQGVHALKVRPEWVQYSTPAMSALPLSALLEGWNADPIPSALEYTIDWTHKYSYLMLLGSPQYTFEGTSELVIIATRGRFALYKISP
jgi:hypothetical protein